nr:hypothetical protein [uncultured Desulfobacter sp.]
MDKIFFFKKFSVLAAASLIIGCAGSPKPEPSQMALGRWQNLPINADGSKDDWPRSAPQYQNSETETKIWISNDAKKVCLLAEIKNPEIARQLTQGNLILTVETNEKDAKPFLIQLKGHTPFIAHGEQGQDTPTPASTPQDRPSMPGGHLPDALVVTYPFSSGPVTMSMKEARSTGIALGLADAGRHTLIFEAVIRFDAIFYNVPPIPGTVINIVLSAKDRSYAMKRRKDPNGNENPNENKDEQPKGTPPGGEPPDHGSFDHKNDAKPDDVKQKKSSNEAFRAAVKITLAGPTE